MFSILNITYDIRDSNGNEVTTAVSNLIKQTDSNFKSFTIDINRVAKISKEKCILTDSKLELNVFGFPYGLFLIKHLNRTYNKIIASLDDSVFNLVHSHKLSFEGVIGYKFAVTNNIPLVITLRQTDFFVMKYRPDLIPLFKSMLIYSTKIFILLPSMLNILRKIFGNDFFSTFIKDKIVMLPNIVQRAISDKTVTSENYFLTIARMTKKSVIRKNLKRLLIAFSKLQKNGINLKIIGSGQYIHKIKKWIVRYNLENKVELLGAIENNEIDNYYSKAIAFVMPSKSESFGMVYAESLLNGVPIMYSKNVLGFDGFFENCGIAVNPFSVNSILEGLQFLLSENISIRNNIKILKNNNEFNIFSANHIKQLYNNTLLDVIDNN